MGSVTPGDVRKDDPELEDENLPKENGLLSQKTQQCSLVSNSGKWLQLVKNGPKGSLSRAASFLFDNKIPRHLVSLDEKYLRRCLDLINITAFKSASCNISFSLPHSFDSTVMMIPKEYVARIVFDLPLVDDSGNIVISPTITGCKRVTTHMVDDKPLLCDGDDVVSLSSTNSVSSSSASSEQSSSCWSPSSTVSQGTLQFTMKDNKTPHFVFSLDDQKEIIYVASLSTTSFGFDRSSLDYSYLIHLKKGRDSELVGKLKVSTSFSVSSKNETVVERQFVLFSNGVNPQLPAHNDVKKSRGLSKKVVHALRSTTRASRQRSDSRFSSASSVADSCYWEPFQEPDLEEPVSLLDDDLPSNLETSAVVVREEYEEEKVGGGWGMKFLKKDPLARTKHSTTSIDVVIPSGIHGGPRSRNGGGPSSLVGRWKSGGSCDCSGWDLGCPLTIFKGQARKEHNEGQCNLFELFSEGSKQGVPGVRIMSVRDGLYFVLFQAKISVLQSFSIALAYIHSQSQRLRPWSSGKCIEKVN